MFKNSLLDDDHEYSQQYADDEAINRSGLDENGKIVSPLDFMNYHSIHGNKIDDYIELPRGMTKEDFKGMDPTAILTEFGAIELSPEDHEFLGVLQAAQVEQKRITDTKNIELEQKQRLDKSKQGLGRYQNQLNSPPLPLDDKGSIRIRLPNNQEITTRQADQAFDAMAKIIPGFEDDMKKFLMQDLMSGEVDEEGRPKVGGLKFSSNPDDPLGILDKSDPNNPLNHPLMQGKTLSQLNQEEDVRNRTQLENDMVQRQLELGADPEFVCRTGQEQLNTLSVIGLARLDPSTIGKPIILKGVDLSTYSAEERDVLSQLDALRGQLQKEIVMAKRQGNEWLVARQLELLKKQQNAILGRFTEQERADVIATLSPDDITLNPMRLEPSLWAEERRLFFELYNMDRVMAKVYTDGQWWYQFWLARRNGELQGTDIDPMLHLSDRDIEEKLTSYEKQTERLRAQKQLIMLQHQNELEKVNEILEKRKVFFAKQERELERQGLTQQHSQAKVDALLDRFSRRKRLKLLQTEHHTLQFELNAKASMVGYFDLNELERQDYKRKLVRQSLFQLSEQNYNPAARFMVQPDREDKLSGDDSSQSEVQSYTTINNYLSPTKPPIPASVYADIPSRRPLDPNNPNAAFDEILASRPTLRAKPTLPLVNPETGEDLPIPSLYPEIDANGKLISRQYYQQLFDSNLRRDQPSQTSFGELNPTDTTADTTDGTNPDLAIFSKPPSQSPANFVMSESIPLKSEVDESTGDLQMNEPASKPSHHLPKDILGPYSEHNINLDQLDPWNLDYRSRVDIPLSKVFSSGDFKDDDKISALTRNARMKSMEIQSFFTQFFKFVQEQDEIEMNSEFLDPSERNLLQSQAIIDINAHDPYSKPNSSSLLSHSASYPYPHLSNAIQNNPNNSPTKAYLPEYRSAETQRAQDYPHEYLEYKYDFYLPVYDSNLNRLNFYDWTKLAPQPTPALRPLKIPIDQWSPINAPPFLTPKLIKPTFPRGTKATAQNLHKAYRFLWDQVSEIGKQRRDYNSLYFPDGSMGLANRGINTGFSNRSGTDITNAINPHGSHSSLEFYQTHPIYRTHMTLFEEMQRNNERIVNLLHDYNNYVLKSDLYTLHHTPSAKFPTLFQLLLRDPLLVTPTVPHEMVQDVNQTEWELNPGQFRYKSKQFLDLVGVPKLSTRQSTSRLYTTYGDIDFEHTSVDDDINTIGYYTSELEIPSFEQYLDILQFDSVYKPAFPESNQDIVNWHQVFGEDPYFHYSTTAQRKQLVREQLARNQAYITNLITKRQLEKNMAHYKGDWDRIDPDSDTFFTFLPLEGRDIKVSMLPNLPSMQDYHYFFYPQHRLLYNTFEKYFLKKVTQSDEHKMEQYYHKMDHLLKRWRNRVDHWRQTVPGALRVRPQDVPLELSQDPLPPRPRLYLTPIGPDDHVDQNGELGLGVGLDELSWDEMIAECESKSNSVITSILSHSRFLSNIDNLYDSALHIALAHPEFVRSEKFWGLEWKENKLPYVEDLLTPPLNPLDVIINPPKREFITPPEFIEVPYYEDVWEIIPDESSEESDQKNLPSKSFGLSPTDLFDDEFYDDDDGDEISQDLDGRHFRAQQRIERYLRPRNKDIRAFELLEPSELQQKETDLFIAPNRGQAAALAGKSDTKDKNDIVSELAKAEHVDDGFGPVATPTPIQQSSDSPSPTTPTITDQDPKKSEAGFLGGWLGRWFDNSTDNTAAKIDESNQQSDNGRTEIDTTPKFDTVLLTEQRLPASLDLNNPLDEDTSTQSDTTDVPSDDDYNHYYNNNDEFATLDQPSSTTNDDIATEQIPQQIPEASPASELLTKYPPRRIRRHRVNKQIGVLRYRLAYKSASKSPQSSKIPLLGSFDHIYDPQHIKKSLQYAGLGPNSLQNPFNFKNFMAAILKYQYGYDTEILQTRFTQLFLSYYRHRVNSFIPTEWFTVYTAPHVPMEESPSPPKISQWLKDNSPLNHEQIDAQIANETFRDSHNSQSDQRVGADGDISSMARDLLKPASLVDFVSNDNYRHKNEIWSKNQYKRSFLAQTARNRVLAQNFDRSLMNYPVRIPPRHILAQAYRFEQQVKEDAKRHGELYNIGEITAFLEQKLFDLDPQRVLYTSVVNETPSDLDKIVFDTMKLDAQGQGISIADELLIHTGAEGKSKAVGTTTTVEISSGADQSDKNSDPFSAVPKDLLENELIRDQLINVIQLDKKLSQARSTSSQSNSSGDDETFDDLGMLRQSIEFTLKLQQFELEKHLLNTGVIAPVHGSKEEHINSITQLQEELLAQKTSLEQRLGQNLPNFELLGLELPQVPTPPQSLVQLPPELSPDELYDSGLEDYDQGENDQDLDRESAYVSQNQVQKTIDRATQFLTQVSSFLQGKPQTEPSPPPPPPPVKIRKKIKPREPDTGMFPPISRSKESLFELAKTTAMSSHLDHTLTSLNGAPLMYTFSDINELRQNFDQNGRLIIDPDSATTTTKLATPTPKSLSPSMAKFLTSSQPSLKNKNPWLVVKTGDEFLPTPRLPPQPPQDPLDLRYRLTMDNFLGLPIDVFQLVKFGDIDLFDDGSDLNLSQKLDLLRPHIQEYLQRLQYNLQRINWPKKGKLGNQRAAELTLLGEMSTLPRYFEFNIFQEPPAGRTIAQLTPIQLSATWDFIRRTHERTFLSEQDVFKLKTEFEANRSIALAQYETRLATATDLTPKEILIRDRVRNDQIKLETILNQLSFQEPPHIKSTPLPTPTYIHPEASDIHSMHVNVNMDLYEQQMALKYDYSGKKRPSHMIREMLQGENVGNFQWFEDMRRSETLKGDWVDEEGYFADLEESGSEFPTGNKSIFADMTPDERESHRRDQFDTRRDMELSKDELSQRYDRRRQRLERKHAKNMHKIAIQQLDHHPMFNPRIGPSTYYLYSTPLNHFTATSDDNLYGLSGDTSEEGTDQDKKLGRKERFSQKQQPPQKENAKMLTPPKAASLSETQKLLFSSDQRRDLGLDQPDEETTMRDYLEDKFPQLTKLWDFLAPDQDNTGDKLHSGQPKDIDNTLSTDSETLNTDDGKLDSDLDDYYKRLPFTDLDRELLKIDSNDIPLIKKTVAERTKTQSKLVTFRFSNIPSYDYYNPIYCGDLIEQELEYRSQGKAKERSKWDPAQLQTYIISKQGRVIRQNGRVFHPSNLSAEQSRALASQSRNMDKIKQGFPMFPIKDRLAALGFVGPSQLHPVDLKPWSTLSPSLAKRFKEDRRFLEDEFRLNTALLHPIEVSDALEFFDRHSRHIDLTECYGYVDRLRLVIDNRRQEYRSLYGELPPHLAQDPPRGRSSRDSLIMYQVLVAEAQLGFKEAEERQLWETINHYRIEKFLFEQQKAIGETKHPKHEEAMAQGFLSRIFSWAKPEDPQKKLDMEKLTRVQRRRAQLDPSHPDYLKNLSEMIDLGQEDPEYIKDYAMRISKDWNIRSEQLTGDQLAVLRTPLLTPDEYNRVVRDLELTNIRKDGSRPLTPEENEFLNRNDIDFAHFTSLRDPKHANNPYPNYQDEWYDPEGGIIPHSGPDSPFWDPQLGHSVDPTLENWQKLSKFGTTKPQPYSDADGDDDDLESDLDLSLLPPEVVRRLHNIEKFGIPEQYNYLLDEPREIPAGTPPNSNKITQSQVVHALDDPLWLPPPKVKLDSPFRGPDVGIVNYEFIKKEPHTYPPRPQDQYLPTPPTKARGFLLQTDGKISIVDPDPNDKPLQRYEDFRYKYPVLNTNRKEYQDALVRSELAKLEYFPPMDDDGEPIINIIPGEFGSSMYMPHYIDIEAYERGDLPPENWKNKDFVGDNDRHLELLMYRPTSHPDGFFREEIKTIFDYNAFNYGQTFALKHFTPKQLNDFFYAQNPMSQAKALQRLDYQLSRGQYQPEIVVERYRTDHDRKYGSGYNIPISVYERMTFIDPNDAIEQMIKFKQENPDYTLQKLLQEEGMKAKNLFLPPEQFKRKLRQIRRDFRLAENKWGETLDPHNYFGFSPETISGMRNESGTPTEIEFNRWSVLGSKNLNITYEENPEAFKAVPDDLRKQVGIPSNYEAQQGWTLPIIMPTSHPDSLDLVLDYMYSTGIVHHKHEDAIKALANGYRDFYSTHKFDPETAMPIFDHDTPQDWDREEWLIPPFNARMIVIAGLAVASRTTTSVARKIALLDDYGLWSDTITRYSKDDPNNPHRDIPGMPSITKDVNKALTKLGMEGHPDEQSLLKKLGGFLGLDGKASVEGQDLSKEVMEAMFRDQHQSDTETETDNDYDMNNYDVSNEWKHTMLDHIRDSEQEFRQHHGGKSPFDSLGLPTQDRKAAEKKSGGFFSSLFSLPSRLINPEPETEEELDYYQISNQQKALQLGAQSANNFAKATGLPPHEAEFELEAGLHRAYEYNQPLQKTNPIGQLVNRVASNWSHYTTSWADQIKSNLLTRLVDVTYDPNASHNPRFESPTDGRYGRYQYDPATNIATVDEFRHRYQSDDISTEPETTSLFSKWTQYVKENLNSRATDALAEHNRKRSANQTRPLSDPFTTSPEDTLPRMYNLNDPHARAFPPHPQTVRPFTDLHYPASLMVSETEAWNSILSSFMLTRSPTPNEMASTPKLWPAFRDTNYDEEHLETIIEAGGERVLYPDRRLPNDPPEEYIQMVENGGWERAKYGNQPPDETDYDDY